jgi:diaminopropionate ammonia-lyase
MHLKPMKGERFALNPAARGEERPEGLFGPEEYGKVQNFLDKADKGPTTPLISLSALASRLGVGEILLKDESSRWGLNAFKILGVSYAIHRLLEDDVLTTESVLCCATDGNHGLALAHVARKMSLRAHVYVHSHTTQARAEAIRREGAEVLMVDGNYDDAVRRAADDAQRHGWTVISDTSWPGYELVPQYIMAGYTILLEEAAKQWPPTATPEIVLIQAGVGGLLCAVASWLCNRFGSRRPFLISCEPIGAACVLESAKAGALTTLQGSLDTVMAGLSCGTPSHVAWPTISTVVDAFVAVEDEQTEQAMRLLAYPEPPDCTVVAGESGACGLASLIAVLRDEDLKPVRDAAKLGPGSRILVVNTEGATDPQRYRRIVGADTTGLLKNPMENGRRN